MNLETLYLVIVVLFILVLLYLSIRAVQLGRRR